MDYVVGNCRVEIGEGGSRTLYVQDLKQCKAEGSPKAIDINPELASGQKGKDFFQFLEESKPGSVSEIGLLRFGAGSILLIPALSWHSAFGEEETKRVEAIVEGVDVSEKSLVFAAALRSTLAPRTFACMDGGGAGIVETTEDISTYLNLRDFCFSEGFGEIGMITWKGRRRHRVMISSTYLNTAYYPVDVDIEGVIQEEWGKAWDKVPPVGGYIGPFVDPDFMPDRVKVKVREDYTFTLRCILAFEVKNASAEILKVTRMEDDLPSPVSFLDLESGSQGPINRMIAVFFRAVNGRLWTVFYHGGKYFEQMFPVPQEGFDGVALNSKSQRALWVIFKKKLSLPPRFRP